MKRNRFDNLVPETPEDFHISVLDALNRMESVRLRRQRRRSKTMYIAASIAAMLVLSVSMFAALNGRPVREDAVVAPQEAPETPKAMDEVAFTFNGCRLDGECVVLDWTMDSSYDDVILYEYDVRLMKGEKCFSQTGEPQYSIIGDLPRNMALLGKEVLGHELSRSVQQEIWLNHFIWDAGYEADVDRVMITVNFYRPTAEFFEDRNQKFENNPHWMLTSLDGGLEAKPVNWSGNTDDQTPYGENSMTILHDFDEYLCNNPAQSEAEAWEQMREYAELKRTALRMYGYAEWIKGYEVDFDLTEAVAQPEVKEVLP